MKKSTHFLLLVILTTLSKTYGQQIQGLQSSNYGGVYRTTYNPSVLGGSKLKFQINLGAIEGSINHRYFIFIGKNSLLYPLLAAHSTKELYGRSRTMGSLVEKEPVYLTSEIRWPSAMFSIGKYHGVALQFRSRGFVQGQNIPEPVRNLYFKRLDTGSTPAVTEPWGPFTLTQQSFSEMSISYGLQLIDMEDHKLKFGITGKRIFGARISYLKGNSRQYSIQGDGTNPDNSTLKLSNLDYESGYSQVTKSVNIGSLFDADQYGLGWAYDLGFSYELGSYWKSETEKFDENPSYLLRLSGSLTDIGKIKYKTQNSRKITGHVDQAVIDQTALEKISDEGAQGFMDIFPAETDTTFRQTVKLPQAFHLEADIQVFKNFYLNLAQTKRLADTPKDPLNIYIPNTFTITPRFEDEDSDFAFPISFVQGNKGPIFGAMAHFGPIFLGFSNVNVIFSKNSRASMVYLGVSAWKINRRKSK